MLKQFGEDGTDLKLAISWNELGNGLMMNKRWEDATECFQRSIDTLRKRPDFTKTALSFPLVNLGFVYWILGRLDDADKICVEALEDRRAAYGLDDSRSFITGKLLHVFGNVRAAQGRMTESYDFHYRALLQYNKFTVEKSTTGPQMSALRSRITTCSPESTNEQKLFLIRHLKSTEIANVTHQSVHVRISRRQDCSLKWGMVRDLKSTSPRRCGCIAV